VTSSTGSYWSPSTSNASRTASGSNPPIGQEATPSSHAAFISSVAAMMDDRTVQTRRSSSGWSAIASTLPITASRASAFGR
jgi:hypothetical protein